MSAELLLLKTMIYKHCGLVLDGIAEERLHKIVHYNAEQAGCVDLKEYTSLMCNDSKQFDSLVGQLTVNETYFFREPDQLKLLSDVLIPQVLAQKPQGQPVRILSAGCSSGEEPYSLVMALHQIYGERTTELFHFDAGDLDQNVLNKAQEAVYSEFSFRGVDPAVRQRYFQPQARGYKLAEKIRKQVSFYQLNLLAQQYPLQIANYDIIFFRNVSIYFDLETRGLIQRKFYTLMNKQSILFLGSSETLGNDLGVFELVEHAGQYFFIKGDVYRPSNSQALGWPDVSDSAASNFSDIESHSVLNIDSSTDWVSVQPEFFEPVIEPNCSTDTADTGDMVDLEMIRQLIHDGEAQRALGLLKSFSAQADQDYAASLLKGWLLLNKQAFDTADQFFERALAIEAWSIEAMLMKGLMCKWQQRADEACQWFKKVIYTCPECWAAHYYLADTRRTEQQMDAALKSYQTVLRILNANPSADTCLAWIPLPLTVGDALFLSQRHIEQLTTALDTTRVDD